MMTAPLRMRSSRSPGSWPPSGVYIQYLVQTLYQHQETSKAFPESSRQRLPAAWTPTVRAGFCAASRPACITERSAPRTITDLVEAGHEAGRPPQPLPQRRKIRQSLVSVAKGERTRTLREPKLTITASSSSTKTTRPRPYLSWVT